jgi:hypothetical protein
MAGGDEFQANLRFAQDQNEDKENASTAGGSYNGSSTPGGTSDAVYNSQPKEDSKEFLIEQPKKDPQKFLEEKKTEYTRGQDLSDKGESEDDRGIPDGLDPELAKQAMQGGDFGPKDLARYREMYDSKYGGSSGGGSGDGSGGGPDAGIPGGEGFGPGTTGPQQTTYAQQAIDAAAKSNPVDFKALDQRIHDRPLYSQAQADIKHSETFGDTWSWDSAPNWNTDRFKAGEQENRYKDVMKENKYD